MAQYGGVENGTVDVVKGFDVIQTTQKLLSNVSFSLFSQRERNTVLILIFVGFVVYFRYLDLEITPDTK